MTIRFSEQMYHMTMVISLTEKSTTCTGSMIHWMNNNNNNDDDDDDVTQSKYSVYHNRSLLVAAYKVN